ncbi:hypothetical protein QU38_02125, partial [Staphylococcus aureus]
AVHRPGLHRLIEAQALQDASGTRRGLIGVDLVEPLIDMAQPVGFGLRLGLEQQRGALDIGFQHRVEGAGLAARRVLAEIAEAGVARDVDRAGVGLDHPGDRLHQRRLAGAVAPEQRHLLARGDVEARHGQRRRGIGIGIGKYRRAQREAAGDRGEGNA